MSTEDEPGGSRWSDEKEPTAPVIVPAPSGSAAGQIARSIGSIWLITLAFVLIALAVWTVGWWWTTGRGAADDEEAERLQAVHQVILYEDDLEELSREMNREPFMLDEAPRPPALLHRIDAVRVQNEAQRRFNHDLNRPRPSSNPQVPQCLDPTRSNC